MKRYRVVVDARVIEHFDCLTKRERGAEFPHSEGHTRIADKAGRANEVQDFGVWRITYWVDGSVHEVRVADVEQRSPRTRKR